MPPVGLEPTISAGERPQTYALDRVATGRGYMYTNNINYLGENTNTANKRKRLLSLVRRHENIFSVTSAEKTNFRHLSWQWDAERNLQASESKARLKYYPGTVITNQNRMHQIRASHLKFW